MRQSTDRDTRWPLRIPSHVPRQAPSHESSAGFRRLESRLGSLPADRSDATVGGAVVRSTYVTTFVYADGPSVSRSNVSPSGR